MRFLELGRMAWCLFHEAPRRSISRREELYFDLRPTYGYKQVIAEMWRASDLIECLIFLALALMLVYTLFVTARFFRRYFLARRKSFFYGSGATAESQQSKKNFIAELSCGVGTLKAIAAYAPFLGLAGTAYGILALFSRGLIGATYPFDSTIPLEVSTALVATAAGLIVAIPTAVCYNVLCIRLERLRTACSGALLQVTRRSYGFAQTLPLRRRFTGMPAFALIAAPVLAILLPMFALLLYPGTPRGLSVHLLKIAVGNYDPAPVVVSVIDAGPTSEPKVYVDSKETSWSELDGTLKRQLRLRPRWIVYVAADENVSWSHVAYAIDVARGLQAEVVLLTARPLTKTGNSPKTKKEIRK
jgi:biopolymer transport protein ExbB/TolQ/biopolymer transport protein ExbD